MKKTTYVAFGLILVFCLLACSGVHYYRMDGKQPDICIVPDAISLRDAMYGYLDVGYEIEYTRVHYNISSISSMVTGFYLADKDLIYAKDDINSVLTELWFLKSIESPFWCPRATRHKLIGKQINKIGYSK
jgi:hypothetical protein